MRRSADVHEHRGRKARSCVESTGLCNPGQSGRGRAPRPCGGGAWTLPSPEPPVSLFLYRFLYQTGLNRACYPACRPRPAGLRHECQAIRVTTQTDLLPRHEPVEPQPTTPGQDRGGGERPRPQSQFCSDISGLPPSAASVGMEMRPPFSLPDRCEDSQAMLMCKGLRHCVAVTPYLQ